MRPPSFTEEQIIGLLKEIGRCEDVGYQPQVRYLGSGLLKFQS